MTTVNAEGVNGDMMFIFTVNPNPYVRLQFFNNYTVDGSDRDSVIPYTYSGDFTLNCAISRSADTPNCFVGGYSIHKLTFNIATQITGATFVGVPTYSIISTSLPDGISASYSNGSIILGYDDYELDSNYYRNYFSITMHVEMSITASASSFGSSYPYIYLQFISPTDYSGSQYYFTSPDDYNKLTYTWWRNQLLGISGRINSTINGFSDSATNLMNRNHSDLIGINNTLNTRFDGLFDLLNIWFPEINNNIINWAKTINSTLTTFYNRNHTDLVQLHTDLTQYDSTAGGLDGANDQFKSEMDSFRDNTDTSAQYDKIGDDIFTFNADFFSSLASTVTFFSSVTSAIFSALGDFAVPLELFLVMVFISLVLGIVSRSGRGGGD